MLDRLASTSHRLFYVAVLGMAGSGIFMALQTGLPAIAFGSGGALPADFWAFPVRTVHHLGGSRIREHGRYSLWTTPVRAAPSSAARIHPTMT